MTAQFRRETPMDTAVRKAADRVSEVGLDDLSDREFSLLGMLWVVQKLQGDNPGHHNEPQTLMQRAKTTVQRHGPGTGIGLGAGAFVVEIIRALTG